MFDTQYIVNWIIQAANWLANILVTGINLTRGEIADLESNVLGELGDQTQELTGVANASEARIREAILGLLVGVQNDSGRNADRVIGALEGAIQQEVGGLRRTTETGIGSILENVAVNAGLVESLESNVLNAVQDVESGLGSILEILVEGVGATIENTIVLDSSIFGTVLDTVGRVLAESNEQNAGVLKTITNVLGGLLGDLVDKMESELGGISPELLGIWKTLKETQEKQVEIATKTTDRTAEGYGGTTVRSTIEEISPGLELSSERLKRSYVDFVTTEGGLDCLTPEERDIVINGVNLEGFALKIMNFVGGALAPFLMLTGIAQARAQATVLRWNECNPTLPLPPAETVLAFQRGFIDADETSRNLRKQGWSADDAEKVVNVGFRPPDLQLSYAMWLRDEIDDDAFHHMLEMNGYPPSLFEPLKKLAFFIPPVQDLITMAVREVFTPEIAEAQGQFEDFPEDFAAWAKKQGVSEEWSRNYWAAHWSLPSVQMGFEMLHRGVIDQDELNVLLRALDIMPGWREPLTKISFTPFTRVDIRRMHRLGVLTPDQVLRAYKDIGYDEEKAGVQLQFVLAANAEDELVTLDVASDLTRSSILSFYKDGIIGRGAASALLLQAGINIAAAELFMLGADFDIERKDRGDQLGLILDSFRFGGKTITESSDEIRELGLETRERQLALLELERVSQIENKLPTKADLDKFLGASIINSTEYVDMLERQGFSPLWAGRYLKLLDEKE